jgi:glyoxylase-like metal-dependent hydrolase (beta-lactamase superfamily II)
VRYPPTCPDISFDDYLDLSTIGLRAYLLHTPGHSIGSSSLIIDDEIALVGDTLYGGFPNSALPPFADDPALLMQSWEKLLDAGCKLYLPSHGKAILRVVLERDYLKQKPKYLSQQRSMI